MTSQQHPGSTPGPGQKRTPGSITAQGGRGVPGDFASSLARTPQPLEARFVTALRSAASTDRFAAYATAADQDMELACRLYLWDRDVEAAILRDIAVVEVALRNALSRQLERAIGPAWYTDRRLGRDKRLTLARDQALQDLAQSGRKPTSAAMTAQLSLGFWVNLLNLPSDPLWRLCLHRAFPGGKTEAAKANRRYQRAWVLSVLQVMRVLRNRCAHHEPLLRGFPLNGQSARVTTTDGIAAYMTIIRMIDRNLADWMALNTATTAILAARPQPIPATGGQA